MQRPAAEAVVRVSRKLRQMGCGLLVHDAYRPWRHTAATLMADAGADAFALASIFGWSDVRKALPLYSCDDEAKRRAVENLVKSNRVK